MPSVDPDRPPGAELNWPASPTQRRALVRAASGRLRTALVRLVQSRAPTRERGLGRRPTRPAPARPARLCPAAAAERRAASCSGGVLAMSTSRVDCGFGGRREPELYSCGINGIWTVEPVD